MRRPSNLHSEEFAYCPHCGSKLGGFSQLRYGNIVLKDYDEVYFENERVNLTRNQFVVIDALVRAKGRLVTLSTLAMVIGGDVFDNTVSVNILRARKRFRSVRPEFDQLKVAHGLSAYRWDFRPMSEPVGQGEMPPIEVRGSLI